MVVTIYICVLLRQCNYILYNMFPIYIYIYIYIYVYKCLFGSVG